MENKELIEKLKTVYEKSTLGDIPLIIKELENKKVTHWVDTTDGTVPDDQIEKITVGNMDTSDLATLVYDTLMENTQWQQFDSILDDIKEVELDGSIRLILENREFVISFKKIETETIDVGDDEHSVIAECSCGNETNNEIELCDDCVWLLDK